MAIVKCSKGHFFDDTRYSQCPHCGILADDDEKTVSGVSLDYRSSAGDDRTVALKPVSPAGAGSMAAPVEDDDKTVRFYQEEKGADLIVG